MVEVPKCVYVKITSLTRAFPVGKCLSKEVSLGGAENSAWDDILSEIVAGLTYKAVSGENTLSNRWLLPAEGGSAVTSIMI